LADAEQALRAASEAHDRARDAERRGNAERDDALRQVTTLARELQGAEQELARLAERRGAAEQRLETVGAALLDREVAAARAEEELGAARAALQAVEAAMEAARERRMQAQVREAHVAARLRGAEERVQRAAAVRAEAVRLTGALGQELEGLAADEASLGTQQAAWTDTRAERRVAVLELDAAHADAREALAVAETELATAETTLHAARHAVESLAEERHGLELRLQEAAARRRSITERVEQEWKRPLDELLEGASLLDLDLETLEQEAQRIANGLEQIGTVNPLAVEEHAEESRRLQFLTSQRDDLVSARQSLLQAIREIDGTARQMFLDTFEAVRGHFMRTFQTLFGGGECDLRLANPDEPLDCDIDILAAPKGKKTQRIHLLSSGERTLVATSLLFGIYLTKPSPFCLMDEVDAPLDDANVIRFCRLLEEFKGSTQFLVITHNPRTMHHADAVYGVTMQEPGVSTIVGVRLGAAESAVA
ncbi:MAG: hypothetical protein NW201_13495, partial [Gemmatimonadales bacterium]|nr:hypothetical protein [Gemmatimonadales bacterium]